MDYDFQNIQNILLQLRQTDSKKGRRQSFQKHDLFILAAGLLYAFTGW